MGGDACCGSGCKHLSSTGKKEKCAGEVLDDSWTSDEEERVGGMKYNEVP